MLTPCQAEIHKTKLDNELSQNRTNKVLMNDMLLRLIVCEIYHYKNTFKIYDSLETTEIFFLEFMDTGSILIMIANYMIFDCSKALDVY